ncbi:MAG: FAD-dependent thymidylate synthase [bacterium]|nr:FAD-dependent thymidylate synthase [bacterium]
MKVGAWRVELVAHTPEPDRLCTAAARLSQVNGSATEVLAGVPADDPGDTLSNVMGMGHRSVAEHASFTVAFENVPVFFEQFLIEHRLASYTVKSRRYVDFRDCGAAVPPSLQGEDAIEYLKHIETLFENYAVLKDSGIPTEDARFVLPYGLHSDLFATMNGREWLHFLFAAIEGRGKRYRIIVDIAERIWAQLYKVAPRIFTELEALENRPDTARSKTLKAARMLGLKTEVNTGARSQLLSNTPDPELTLARVSLIADSGADTDDVVVALKKNPKFVAPLCREAARSGRSRELEQIGFTFRIDGLSLPALTHLARHRMQALYVPELVDFAKYKGFTLPASVGQIEGMGDRYIGIVEKHRMYYKEKLEKRLPEEELIYAILCGRTVSVVTTMHARQLLHFFRLRTCERAQWEIRAAAEEMLHKCREVAPNIFYNAGPGCVYYGLCPEGKLTCGNFNEVRKKYGVGE